MIKNYFKIAFRNLWKNKGITALQLLGLSAGLAVCILILMTIKYENSFDKYNSKGDRIYRIVSDHNQGGNVSNSVTTPYPLAAAMKAEFPELEKVSAIHHTSNSFVQLPDKSLFKENDVFFCEPDFLDILDVPLIRGNAKQSLANPGNAVITSEIAKKYFGTNDAIGKTFRLENKIDLQVTAIMDKWPATSHIRPNILVSYSSFSKEYLGLPIEQWGMNISGRTYILTPENFNPEAFERKMVAFVKKYYPQDEAPFIKLGLQPLFDFHLSDKYKPDGETTAVSSTYLQIFGWIAALILLIAVINYVNLSTARSGLRSREIGVRKVIGATKKQVMLQFLAESVLFTVFAGVFAVVLAALMLPWLNKLFEKFIPFYFSLPALGIYAIGILLLGCVAGVYPSLILASVKPLSLVQAKSYSGNHNKNRVRQALVAVQFACAIAFVFGSIVIAMQIYYVRHKDPGFKTEKLVNVSIPEPKHLEEMRRDWQNIPGVEDITFNLGAPVSENNFGTSLVVDAATNRKIDLVVKPVDYQYPKTYGLTLLAGRWLTKEDEKYADHTLPDKDQRYNFVINEKLAKALGYNDLQEALGKKYQVGVNDIIGEIVGVVKDFHYKSLHDPIEPLLLMNFSYFFSSAGIKLKTESNPATIEAIKKIYASYFPNALFEYEFMDKAMDRYYKNDEQAFRLLMFITVLAVLLAALGLVGLSVFVIQRRTKEIGIRKVLGSTVNGIVKKLSWEFLQPVLLACLVAFPLSWWAMNKWLENFAYRISITIWIPVITAFVAVIIALITVGFQSLKAAYSNPVKSLRTE